jgi:hypothetical protein
MNKQLLYIVALTGLSSMHSAEYLGRLGTHFRDNKTNYVGAAALTAPVVSAVWYFGPEASQKFVTKAASNVIEQITAQVPTRETITKAAASDAAITTYKYCAASLLGVFSGAYGYERLFTKPLRKELAKKTQTIDAVDSYLETNGKKMLPENVTAETIFQAQELAKTEAALTKKLANVKEVQSKITCTPAAQQQAPQQPNQGGEGQHA